MRPKKLSKLLFVPAISLSLNTNLAFAHANHAPETPVPPHSNQTSIRDKVIPGTMFNDNTLQINSADLAKLKQTDAIRVITLTDKYGHKQRFVLLTPTLSQFGKELMQYKGRLKEFQLYAVVDENGKPMSLLASKRIVSAPANQITALFDSAKAAEGFFTPARQKALAAESLIFPELHTQEALSTEQVNELDAQIKTINETVAIQGQDKKKSGVLEPIALFPTLSIIVVSRAALGVLPPISP